MERKESSRGVQEKIDHIIEDIRNDLNGSIEPRSFSKLNAYERKLVHRYFDHNPDVVTKTYRDGEDFELMVYPVGNLRQFALERADESVKKGNKIKLPHMTSYARYVVHDALKDRSDIKVKSHGDGDERHIEIEPEMYGRGLKRIIKKISLL